MDKWLIDDFINENIGDLAETMFYTETIMNILGIDRETTFERLFYLASQSKLDAFLVWEQKDGSEEKQIALCEEGKFDLNDFGGAEHPPLDELYVKFKVSKEYKEFRDEWKKRKKFEKRKYK
ncbi:hypothetical protein ASG46_05860 [Bacillus sp. Leaf49]|uniref:hypothetical protein n=1 Tax=Bacillus sp. Leaf49 TaxID=1736222 RepID=UPI0006FD26FE|nr:hypothetical protein [Bacillus sp. Leaf49]KQU12064.1 hypothetical protein ASG46_05860 [Bacillus sp. Leaf49]